MDSKVDTLSIPRGRFRGQLKEKLGRALGILAFTTLACCGQDGADLPAQRLEAGNAMDTVRVAIEARLQTEGNLDGLEDGPVLESGLDLGERSYDGTHYSASDYIVTVRGEAPTYAGTTVEATGESRGSVHMTLRFSDVSRSHAIVSP